MLDTSDKISVDLDTADIQGERKISLAPYIPARQHDWVRTVVTVGLLSAFGGVIFWACRQSVGSALQWTQTKEMLQILLPAITGLLGSVLGFYFGTGATSSNQRRP